jgi:acyl-coenzyme A synthetase/AMP-(fatty) acid ligase
VSARQLQKGGRAGHDRDRTLVVPPRRLAGVLAGRHHQEAARDRLAHYKCPAGVTFTTALTRTASGKLQKQAIRSSLATAAVS